MKDHRELGKQLELFMFSELSPGNPIWLPKGNTVYSLLADKIRAYNRRQGYVEVRTPIIWKPELFKTSGHWDHFKQNMFIIGDEHKKPVGLMGNPCEHLDPDTIAEMVKEPETFVLKPMNCPGHMVIFKSQQWSYKELPYRIHDQGVLHRNESSGALGGLTRCRSFCQDDGHVFSTPEALETEIRAVIMMVKGVYGHFNMAVRATLSTRPDQFMGQAAEWDHAENVLESTIKWWNMPYEVAAGQGAFYGPKIDFVVTDSIGREWQTATVQLDFQLPQRFELRYCNAQDQDCTPIVIHRAIYGSLERFIGILLEHTQGKLPFWLAPIQVAILPINDRNVISARNVGSPLWDHGIRFEMNESNNTLAQKVATSIEKQIPYIVVIGDREEKSGSVSIRGGETLSVSDFANKMIAENQFSF